MTKEYTNTTSTENTDVLIVGMGISGLVLALTLMYQRRSFRIIHLETVGSSSRAAAGLFNPVTGRRPTLTWNASACFPFLHSFYPRAEKTLNSYFFFPKPVFRPAIRTDMLNDFHALSASSCMATYIEVREVPELHSIDPTLGVGLLTHHSGYLNSHTFLDSGLEYFTIKGLLHNKSFDHAALTLTNTGAEYEGEHYRYVIFCEGSRVIQNPWFGTLPFFLYHGEVLDVYMPTFPETYCVNRGVFVLPVGGNIFKVGATYAKGNTYQTARKEGVDELISGLKALGIKHFDIVESHWGVRPATKDRKPMVGVHPNYAQLGVFNGMGSKAVSLAPLLAHQLVGHLFNMDSLNPDVTMLRFKSFLS